MVEGIAKAHAMDGDSGFEARLDARLDAHLDAGLDAQLVRELPALREYVRRLAGRGAGRSEVEDLVQESVARALRYRAAFDAQRAIGPWLRGVALRAFLDLRDRRSRAPRELETEPEAEAASSTDAVDHRDEMEITLSVLSDVERDVVVRFHARGESVREIATALALPEGTVKSHLHRARRKLGAGGTP